MTGMRSTLFSSSLSCPNVCIVAPMKHAAMALNNACVMSIMQSELE